MTEKYGLDKIRVAWPDDNEDVLIASELKKTIAATFREKDNEFGRYRNEANGDRVSYYYYVNVTHWAKMPTLPHD